MNRQIQLHPRHLIFALFLSFASVCMAEQTAATALADEGSVTLFIGIFLIGLMLNLTPCVYPMLAITVTILGKTADDKSVPPFLRSLIYIIGMATMYSTLGVIAALTGGVFGSMLQSPAVLGLIAIIFLLLSLSMFGIFELQPPAWLLNKIGSQRKTSVAGLFVSGLFVGIFAAPCVGPPVIALLTLVGQRGDILFGFLTFFVLSMGLGLPYLILGSFSGLMQKLPRSGHWMLWVKKLFGLLLLAVAVFYFSLAISPEMSFTLIPLVLLIGGLYLGFLDSVPDSSSAFRFGKYATGALLIGAAVYFWSAGQLQSIEWRPYSEKSQAEGKPTVLYFSASWCIPCLELDRRTFTDKRVIDKVSSFNHYKIDLTSYESENSLELRQRYRIAGVPTIIFLDAEGKEFATERVVGFVSAEDLLGRIERVGTGQSSSDVASEPEELIPSRISILSPDLQPQPGQSLNIGILFQMVEGWHVYWKNPGDSGTEPEIEWLLPPGFTVSEPEWIAPQLFSKPPFATFGHENELLLMFAVKVPDDYTMGAPFDIGAKVSWLVCREICIGQDDQVKISFPQNDVTAAGAELLQQRFASFATRIPIANHNFLTSATQDNRSVKLLIDTNKKFPDESLQQAIFFPADPGVFRHGYTRLEAKDGKISIELVRTGLPFSDVLSGVLSLPENQSFTLNFNFK